MGSLITTQLTLNWGTLVSGLGFRVLDLGFPKIRGTCLGVPITRTTVFGGVSWDPSIWGNYHIKGCRRV